MPGVDFAGPCADIACASSAVVRKSYTYRFFYGVYRNISCKRIVGR